MSPPLSRLLLAIVMNAGRGPVGKDHLNPSSIDDFEKLATLAHKGTFDALFLPDLPHLNPTSTGAPLHVLDPFLLLTALSRTVPDIGLVPTISTTLTDPYTVARSVASLDLISDGRAGVNAITSWNVRSAMSYGFDTLPSYDDRYRRSAEFVDVLTKLSDSWPAPPAGARLHVDQTTEIDHQGEFFTLRSTLTAPQTRQGRPLLSVAGGSEHAKDQAARQADMLYTAVLSKDSSVELRRDISCRSQTFGRTAAPVKIFPGLIPVLGSTAQEADRLQDELTLEAGDSLDPVDVVARQLELDPSTLHPDRPLNTQQLTLPESWTRPIGFFHSITDLARRENLTVGELGRRIQLSVGHAVVVGTPDVVARTITDWWLAGGADGFILHLPRTTQTLETFVNEVIPLLQQSAGVPTGYTGDTLNERFGVQR